MTSFPFPRPSKPHSSPNMTFHTSAVLAPGRVRLPENSELNLVNRKFQLLSSQGVSNQRWKRLLGQISGDSSIQHDTWNDLRYLSGIF